MEAENNNEFRITVSEGSHSDGTLCCELSPKSSAVDMEIRWFKETDCVCFYKNGRLIEGESYKGIMSLCIEELKEGIVSLQLKEVRESCVGDYLCQVTSGDRTEEITIRTSLQTLEDQNEMPQQVTTLGTKQSERKWTSEQRIKMLESALLAVFNTLEKNQQKEDVQGTSVMQADISVEENQDQTEEKDTQQKNISKPTEERRSFSEMDMETAEEINPGNKISCLGNQHPGCSSQKSLESVFSSLDWKEDVQGTDATVMHIDKSVEGNQDQTEEKDMQQKHISRPKGLPEMDMKTSACNPVEQETKAGNNISCLGNQEPGCSSQKSLDSDVKVYVCQTGKTNISDFTGILQSRIENLTEVPFVSQSDIILVFCPIVSRAGTDIDNALDIFTHKKETQLAVLVVLHHTFDPEKVVPDSSKYIKRTDILTVDCLFWEDTGFLKCQKNSDVADRVVNWLIEQGRQTGVKIRPRQNFTNAEKIQNQESEGCFKIRPRQRSERSNSNKNECQINPSSNAKKQKIESNEPGTNPFHIHFEKVKVFSILAGKINCHQEFFTTLRNQIGNLKEGRTVKESDIILVFCPIVSRAGTDIEAALNKIVHSTDSKLTVLVVIHHTFDPEKVVPDSRRCVNRTDILTVDCLFYEDKGFLKCEKNSDAADRVVNWLIQQGGQKGVKICLCKNFTSAEKIQHQESEGWFSLKKMGSLLNSKMGNKEPSSVPVHFPEKVKVFSILAEKINCHREFFTALRNRIGNLEEGCTVEESNIILVFCPSVSRPGTDIEAALNKIVHSTDSKRTVLVVLHHTFDPEKVVTDSRKYVNRTDILTVDCLFYEDTGLLKCQKNSDAADKTVNWLIQQAGELPKQKSNVQEMTCSSSRPVDYFVHVTKYTQNCDVDFIDALHKQVSLRQVRREQESEIILLFSPVYSQSDINSTLKKYKRRDKPAVVIFLHETLDSDSVPDSSGYVKSQDVLVVDCIFCDGEGLPACEKNLEAISAVAHWIKNKLSPVRMSRC